jgi:serine/threonine-protein kinase
MLVVAALGPLDVRDPVRGSLATLLAQPRRAALVAYLAVEGGDGFVSRDRLLGVFWPEADESRARAALRQALVFVRRALGAEAVRTRGDDDVGLDPTLVSCDVWQLRAAIAAGRLEEAMGLVRGEFLAGLLLDDAPEFERWCAAQRALLDREVASALDRGAREAAAQGALAPAISYARRAQALDPFNEARHRTLLALLDRGGDRGGAMREHEAFAARLRAELEVEPSPETEALVREIRDRVAAPAAGAPPAGAPAAGAPAAAHAPTAPAPLPAAAALPPTAGSTPRNGPIWRRLGWLGVAAAASLAAVFWMRPERGTTQKQFSGELSQSRFAVLPLSSSGRDSAETIGAMAADWIVEGLSRLDGVEVVPLSAVLASEGGLAHDSAPSAGDQWARIASEVGAGVVVRGTVYREGGQVHLQVQLLETATGRIVRPVEPVSVPPDSLMAGIDRLRTRVLAAVAPLADTVTHLRRAVPPPSAEAYRNYVTGLQLFMRGDPRAALALYERSLAADPDWPMPRIAAAIMLTNLGQSDYAVGMVAPLRTESARLGPLESSTLDMLEGLMQGHIAAVYDASVRQARIAPGSIGHYMVAESARRLGRAEEALQVLSALDPDRGELRGWRAFWRERTFALHQLGRFAEEAESAREAVARYPDDVAVHLYLVRALASAGDTTALPVALDALDAATGAPGSRAEARATVVVYARRYHAELAPWAVARARGWFEALSPSDRAVDAVRFHEARVLLLAGAIPRAQDLLHWFADEPDLPASAIGRLGIASAMASDTASARRWMDRLEADAAALSPAQRGASWGEHAYWRAAIAAQLGEREQALELFRQARREGLSIEPRVLSEPAFDAIREWPPFRASLGSATR